MRSVNVVPFPISLSTSMDPPMRSMICLQMQSPSPVPRLLTSLCSARLSKEVNSLLYPSLLMPFPLSLIIILVRCLTTLLLLLLTSHRGLSARSGSETSQVSITLALISTLPPSSVNLRAFEVKLTTTCYRRPQSPYTCSNSREYSGAIWVVVSIYFDTARNSRLESASFKACSTEKRPLLIENELFSAFAMSRRSLMRFKRMVLL
mmetsp:Transcript_10357/g.15921  ORF Transcript_10357/g.15921 Transcript_10357/m.15921 type:complete len:206 (+) Transcript_10357:769-1386(+)